MKLDEALAVWAYMQHQYKPSAEGRRLADEAWKVICPEANRLIYPPDQSPQASEEAND